MGKKLGRKKGQSGGDHSEKGSGMGAIAFVNGGQDAQYLDTPLTPTARNSMEVESTTKNDD